MARSIEELLVVNLPGIDFRQGTEEVNKIMRVLGLLKEQDTDSYACLVKAEFYGNKSVERVILHYRGGEPIVLTGREFYSLYESSSSRDVQ